MSAEQIVDQLTGAVSPARIEHRILELAKIGGLPNGGMNRLPYSPEDKAARNLFTSWLSQLGWSVRVDNAGNVIARLAGTDPERATIMAGSHLDTQPGGGRYDGIAGVVAATEAAEAMAAVGYAPRTSLEFVAWAGEEGSGRFDVGLIGSRAMIGQLERSHLAGTCRFTNETLEALMRSTGSDPDQLDSVERAPGSIAAVLELHIEQGPYLEEQGLPVAIVTDISGNRRIPLRIQGVQAHSGAQPMSHRRDALCAAAEIVLAAEAAATRHTGPWAVATSGYSSHEPHVIAAVPGRAEMVIDVRSTDLPTLLEVTDEIIAAARAICDRRHVGLTVDDIWGLDPTATSNDVAEVIAGSCRALDIPFVRLPSGAGHDSLMLGKRFPAGMIFVPSKNGVSHAPEEFTDVDDIATGTKVLTATIHALSERP